MAEREEIVFHQDHPYLLRDQRGHAIYGDGSVNEWTDCFRSVFVQSDAGRRVLRFLASHWHFLERSLPCEEWRVQRQCFLDLLMFCGIVDPQTNDRVIEAILEGALDHMANLRCPRRPEPPDLVSGQAKIGSENVEYQE